MTHKIQAPYYPIVYVRGYAMTAGEREDVFYDGYYGFAATSVESREAPPPKFFEVDIFEGQLVRLMKLGEYAYADAMNRGLDVFSSNPSRSVWISRFYDTDHLRSKIRGIEEHAAELKELICETIPTRLEACGVDLGANREDYKVILIAHSMGGLVCRTLIQGLLKSDAPKLIHRLVTIGTPHRGIELGAIPDVLEAVVAKSLNPYDSAIFSEPRMRQYLNLTDEHDVHSIGDDFPVKHCLCVIGSDYKSYGAVQHLAGSFSDGLVKQDRAYVVGGKKRADGRDYEKDQLPFWANVHRAHSGRRGIVNSYETFENIHRFLFGNTLAELSLENMTFPPVTDGTKGFYDIEFLLAVRGTGVYLHRREQDPCENAIRLKAENLPTRLDLQSIFLNSQLRTPGESFSHFALTLRVVERLVKPGFLWDHEYPSRPIYHETIEIRVGDFNAQLEGDEVEYRWLTETSGWTAVQPDGGNIMLPLRAAQVFKADLKISYQPWSQAV